MIKRMTLCVVLSLGALVGCDQKPTQVAPIGNPPAPRIQEFEASAFCRKYHCRLESVEPVVKGIRQELDHWQYRYRLEGNDLMQIDLWRDAKGDPAAHTFVSWYPIKVTEKDIPTAAGTLHSVTRAVPEREIAPVRDLVNGILNSNEYDASAYVKNELLSFLGDKPEVEPGQSKKFPKQTDSLRFCNHRRAGRGNLSKITINIY